MTDFFLHRAGRRPDPAVQEGMRRAIELCNDSPMTKDAMAKALDVKATALNHWLQRLRAAGLLVYSHQPDCAGWMTPRLWRRLLPGLSVPTSDAMGAPVVNAPLRPRWEPAPVVVHHRDGVRFTSAGAPRSRWEADVPRGGGVISRDAAARRAGGDVVGSAWAGYVERRGE